MDKLWDSVVQFLSTTAVDVAIRLVGGLLVLFIGLKLVKWLTGRLKKDKRFTKIDQSAFKFFVSFLSVALKLIIFVTAAAIFGVPLTALVTLLGSAGLAIGLALQGSLSNFAGGLMILLFKPFRVGDYIEITGANSTGTVTDISIFYTTLVTMDNRRIVVPNSGVTGSAIVNCTCLGRRRADLDFSVAYKSDIDAVRRAMLEVAAAHPLILDDPAPFVCLSRQDDSALIFQLRAWCACSDYLTVKQDITEEMKRAFDREGIEIPFPQLDVHTAEA